jgi:hypothetical protein
MSVIPFPNRRVVRPAVSECIEAVAVCEHRPELLLFCAASALNLIRREPSVSEQVAVNRLTIAFLALAELLGVTKAEEALS